MTVVNITEGKTNFAYQIVRYSPSLVREEWVNVGVLLFDTRTGARRFRLIEEIEEFARVRRLHPQADESVLRLLRDHLDERFEHFLSSPPLTAEGKINEIRTGCKSWRSGTTRFPTPFR